MERTFAVVPVKAFAAAKSRLSPVLSPGQRAQLAAALADHVLRVLAKSEEFAEIVVVSPDNAALGLARRLGCQVLVEQAGGDLNAAAYAGVAFARAEGASSVLVVSSDLPLLDVAVVRDLAARSGTAALTIMPDGRGSGTNALWISDPHWQDFKFGSKSCARHLQAARMAGLSARLLSSPGFAFDLDLPADLRSYWAESR